MKLRTIALAALVLMHSARVFGQDRARDAESQTLFGIVSDSTGPLSAAFVEATNARGERVIARLTDTNGRFRLELARGVTYGIHVERLGYADTIAHVQVRAEKPELLHLVMRAQPFTLAPVQAEAKARCRGVTPETAQLWSEVSKVLRVAEWTEKSGSIERDYLLWSRNWRAKDESVISYTPTVVPGRDRAPFRSANPADLVRFGFVRSLGDTTVYDAPDAGTILSPAFLGTHCYSINTEHQFDPEPLIGLGFKPISSVRLPDVHGTLWVSVDSLQLKYLEYQYTNLPSDGELEPGHGRVEFQKLAGGEWIVNRWWIRLPVYALNHKNPAIVTGGPRYDLVSFHEDGGEVRLTRAARTAKSGWGETGSVSGVVYDSIRRRPLGGVVIELEGTPWKSAATDSTGSFSIASVPAGSYALKALGGALDSIPPDTRPVSVVTVATASDTRAQVSIPSYRSLRQKVCKKPDDKGINDEAFIVGVIDDGSAAKAQMVDVIGDQWRSTGGSQRTTLQRSTFKSSAPVGPDGWFRICDVPIGMDMKLSLPGQVPQTTRAEKQSLNFVRLAQPKPDAQPAH